MKSLNKSFISVLVLSVVTGGSIQVVTAAEALVQTTDSSNVFLSIHGQDESIKSYDLDDIDKIKGDVGSNATSISILRGDLDAEARNRVDEINRVDGEAKLAGALADTANQKADTALLGVVQNGSDIIKLQNQTQLQGAVLKDNEQRITSLENAPKPADGLDGKDGAKGDKGDTGATGAQGVAGINGRDGAKGKDGVTTNVTRMQVDTATQTKVANNSQAVAVEAQELQAAKQTLQAMNNNTNQQFKSLHDEVDNNKKEANAGISGAMAMAGLPQVQTNQHVMFSAGGATYNGESALAVGASVNFNSHVIAKVSFSDDTADNMGASVGLGVGF
ncbi:YadA-like family protein [Enterobacter kobei]|uniref:YadA C-terminal domain-containing protein n=1 Tax=Enterobacter TaxID=547 RepID=UPI000796A521|nr:MULTISPECIES: YadA-like family protein [Enterobacter]MCK6798464.1 YadA C-terminal domain-containing protein [Enterobacter kobei]MCK6868747.1 YadA C-terminal domain-containing protein [Enterobacter kobei]MCK7024444.1 YadA C-terminal domain-containing protein [Enterobacter kobei]MCK7293471.1 YadA C-terminal domain-containing protein [Enterobacter kobei]MCK7333203.1 YadA C-terminal domain-containing protein [Enterobacter kobei]